MSERHLDIVPAGHRDDLGWQRQGPSGRAATGVLYTLSPTECHPVSGTRSRAKPRNDPSYRCPPPISWQGSPFLSCSAPSAHPGPPAPSLLSHPVLYHPCGPSRGLVASSYQSLPCPGPHRPDSTQPSLGFPLTLKLTPQDSSCIPSPPPAPHLFILCPMRSLSAHQGARWAPLLISYPTYPRVSFSSLVRVPVAGPSAHRA